MPSTREHFPVADYHMHTPLCQHAEGWPVDYARVAVERGLEEIGFSDHNPMVDQYDDWRMSDAEFPRYLEVVEKARAEYSGALCIQLGMECDYIAGGEKWIERLGSRADFDYLIGSVHYLEPGWAVDDPDPKWSAKWKGSVDAIWERYWELYRQCASTGLFDFLGHPDLVKKFGHRPSGDLKRFYEPTIEVLAATGVAIELSTAGLRKPCAEMYPSTEFLQLAREADIPIVISSDSHRPEEVGADFSTAISLAKEAGYTHTARFSKRERSLVPLN